MLCNKISENPPPAFLVDCAPWKKKNGFGFSATLARIDEIENSKSKIIL